MTYAKRRKLGICMSCPKVSMTARCPECWKRKKEYEKQRIAKGEICVRCKIRRELVGRYCVPCLLKVTENDANKRASGMEKVRAADLMAKFQEQKGVCTYTGRLLTLGKDATLDHIVAVSKGGTNAIQNLQWIHKDANFAKRAMIENDFLQLVRDIYEYRLKTSR